MKIHAIQPLGRWVSSRRSSGAAAVALCLAVALVSACFVQEAWCQMRPSIPGEISGGPASKASVSEPASSKAAMAEAGSNGNALSKDSSKTTGKAGGAGEGRNMMGLTLVGPFDAQALQSLKESSKKAYTDAVTSSNPTPPNLNSEDWSVSAFVSDFTGTTDVDYDNFYEAYTITFGIDAHPPRTPPLGPDVTVRAFFYCPLLGIVWESASWWAATQDDSDMVYFYATESDFAGMISGNTVLTFDVFIVRENSAATFNSTHDASLIRAIDTNLPGPTIMVDAYATPGYDPKVSPSSVETSGTKAATSSVTRPASGGEPGYGF